MKKKTVGVCFIAWFKRRLTSMILLALLIVNYIVVTALMHMDISGVLYSSFLAIFIGLWVAIFDFRKELKVYQSILNTYHNCKYALEALPEPNGTIEESYQKIIEDLYEELVVLKEKMKRQEEETSDYYTLWTHQIKTPIAAMRLVLENLKTKEEIEAYETSLLLEGELFKIEQYVEMAMQYIRLESLSRDLNLKTYDLYEIVSQALKKYAVSFMHKKLTIHIEPFEAKVITDEKWLQFVIEQVISNSIKYTPKGGITIEMKDDHTLKISDTGIGIRSEDLPRIFDRGFTGFNGRMNQKSTGIGLYLCKQVTNKLLHTLEVESTLGEGTSVLIGFPKENQGMYSVQE